MAIRRQSNSDYMSREMDKELEEMERRIHTLYQDADTELRRRLSDYLSQYEEDNEDMRERLDNGDISQEEYERWANSRIIRSQRYERQINALADILVNTDVAAMALVNENLPAVIGNSYNFIASLGFRAAEEAGLSVGNFQIYNARSVQMLIRENPDILPVVDVPEDERWNRSRINREVTQAIIQGDTIPQVADRLQRVTNMDNNAAVRNARTAMTASENMGRAQASRRLRDAGVPNREVWSATMDNRTRDTHLLLDGTYANEDGYFGEGILHPDHLMRFPADPNGEPQEVYNCRCRLSIQLEGIDHSQDGDLYRQFMEENYPEDYESLQARDEETGRTQRRQEAINRIPQARERVQRNLEERLRTDNSPIIPTMTEQNMFEGLNPSETDKNGKTDIDSISVDGNKIAVVLDRQMLIARYDSLGQPQYYVGVGNNEGIAIERWQVSAESHTAEGRQYHAHVVILDRNNFEQRVSIPPLVTQFSKWETYTHEYDDGGIPALNFEDYLKMARNQSNARGYLYGMGRTWGFDDNDNPNHFRPTFRYSQYSSWGEERERERRREQARRRRNR